MTAGEVTAAAASSASRQPRDPRPSRRPRTRVAPLLMLSPAGLVMIALIAVPIGLLVLFSFTDANARTVISGAYNSVGIDNYSKIVDDPAFWAALWRSIWFTVAMVLGSVVIGMALANLLTRLGTVMRYVLTIALIFAWAMPTVASSQVWKWLFQPGYGVVNWLLTQLRIFGDMTQVNWAANTWLGFLCIWLLIVWQAVPFIALTVYAAQTQVDPTYYEAARLDGAGEWRVYRAVTLPFIAPSLILITILSVIWDFNVFNQIWLVTQGGPDGTTSNLGVFTFMQAFVSFKIGYGAAITVITTLILLIITGFYIRRLLRSGEDL
ncbi:carbohydrate ABC transporter permease [Microbacterium sp. ASV49]|uniref:Sugar ABC transporter permease n=1 Tax=Microbacterium candidum TaxID=3041922 RepID=A0ABT7MX03_9MICO|nr:sugar ABC transporter permease [Microbacterium sp. ASV49]MDL9978984.1 sugar ABC transporter permease [Microbacterium sp. ASV49]